MIRKEEIRYLRLAIMSLALTVVSVYAAFAVWDKDGTPTIFLALLSAALFSEYVKARRIRIRQYNDRMKARRRRYYERLCG